MIRKIGSRQRVASLCFVCLLIARFAFAQCPIREEKAKQALSLVRVGELQTANDHRFSFRDYSASDGSTARLVMARSASLDAARQQIDEWMKEADTITCREQNQNDDAQRISDRVLAQATSKDESKTKLFLIIRRDGRDCYLITSTSLQVAKQIEDLIDQTLDNSAQSLR